MDWDATEGRSGGAQQTVWEVLMEMERFDGTAKKEDQGAVAFGPGPGEGLRASQSPCGVGMRNAFHLPNEDIAGAVWLLRAREASAVRRKCGGAVPDLHDHFSRVKVELLASNQNLPSAEVEGLLC